MNRSVARWALLLACLLFAVLGQFYFAKRPEYFWDGALFYAASALCLALLARPAPASDEPSAADPARSREEWLRIAVAAAGIGLGALAVLRLRSPQLTYWPIFWTWVAGMLLCLAATLPRPREAVAGFRQTLAGLGWEPLAVLAIFAFALALRAWRVDSIPWTLSGDEGNFGRWAREALAGWAPHQHVQHRPPLHAVALRLLPGRLAQAGGRQYGRAAPAVGGYGRGQRRRRVYAHAPPLWPQYGDPHRPARGGIQLPHPLQPTRPEQHR
ncbi:MAG: hypothetical protein MUC34_17995 [Anaerolineae bacterium]|nr:hypothetical protein [Anaerolineae bacterium]